MFVGSDFVGTGKAPGTFSLDVGTVPGGSLQSLDSALDAGGFTNLITIRDRDDSALSIDGNVRAGSYVVSLDSGSLTVTGTIDASDFASVDANGNAISVGGTISLTASGSVILASGSRLDASGQNFDNAGKGGSVTLTAGADANGQFSNAALNSSVSDGPLIEVETGSTIDLSVAENNAGSAALGEVTGTLILSAPQTLGSNDLQVAAVGGTIVNASSIVVEGSQVFMAADGSIDNQEANVMANGQTFAGNTAAILQRIFGGNANAASYLPRASVEPGAEIVNPGGDLTLANNWDLSTYRFGPNVVPGVVGSGAPGILTLRAAGNVIFNFGASLSDGFDPSNTAFALSSNPLWTAPLLGAGARSWSYKIVAGADFTAANLENLQSAATLANSGLGGSIIVGEGAPTLPANINGNSRGYVLADLNFFETIRTGTGDIDLDAGGNVELLNTLATIYTAGSQASALTNFTLPSFGASVPQAPNYGAQYSLEGGNVSIFANGDIEHETSAGAADSSLELPTTWLYREGALDANGNFVTGSRRSPKLEETSWWVDFSNFLEGVGALGGGNVDLIAGGSVINVDAVVPTNGRMSGNAPSLANLVELGGGDLLVRAGNDIDGGVYYVERGQGTIEAGNQILTNSTRATVKVGGDPSQAITWLPTALFVGEGSFNVSAGGNLLLGPVANPFLLPQGADNGYVNKSYFSTYGSKDEVNVSSLAGTIVLTDNSDGGNGTLTQFYGNIYLAPNGGSRGLTSEPWLQSAETDFTPVRHGGRDHAGVVERGSLLRRPECCRQPHPSILRQPARSTCWPPGRSMVFRLTTRVRTA